MSNALYRMVSMLAQGETGESSSLDSQLSLRAERLFWVLISIGIMVLVVVVVRRLRTPSKLRLKAAPGRPNRLDPLVVLIAFLFWQLLQFGLHALFVASETAGRFGLPVTLAGLTAQCLAQLVGLVAFLAVASVGFRHGVIRGLGLNGRHWMFDSLRAAAALLASFPPILGLLALSTWVLTSLNPEAVQIHAMLQQWVESSVLERILIVFSAAVLAPLVEELLFRGLLQSTLRTTLGPWGAIGLSSVIFGLVHFSEPQAVPSLILFGVVLGYNYERTGRLVSSILIHALFNGIMILLVAI